MFHVPDRGRVTDGPMGSEPDAGNFGAFVIGSCEPGWELALVCDYGAETGWEHVSVHAFNGPRKSRVPTWREMCYVKDLCWDADDVVVQFHPARSAYVNTHPNVLHLWRRCDGSIPTPPVDLV